MEDIRNQDRRNNMANCNCKGVQIEVICTKRESQKKECYICVMTPDQPSGDYLKAKTSEGLYFIGIPRTVKHVYRAVNVPAEVENPSTSSLKVWKETSQSYLNKIGRGKSPRRFIGTTDGPVF